MFFIYTPPLSYINSVTKLVDKLVQGNVCDSDKHFVLTAVSLTPCFYILLHHVYILQ